MELKDFGDLDFSPATTGDLKRRLLINAELSARSLSDVPLSTGSWSLDRATGIGGVPRGQLVLLTSASFESSSVLALALVSAVQSQGGRIVVIDATEKLWSLLREHVGIGEAHLAFFKAANPQDVLKATKAVVESQLVDLVLLLGPLVGAELKPQLQALSKSVTGGRTAVVALNAGRQASSAHGPAGRRRHTLEGIAGMKISTRPAKGGSVLGGLLGNARMAVEIARAGARELLPTAIEFRPDGTVSKTGDLLEYGLAEGYIERHGSIYKTAAGETLGRGRLKAKQNLDALPDFGLILESMAERNVDRLQQRSAANTRRDEKAERPLSFGVDEPIKTG